MTSPAETPSASPAEPVPPVIDAFWLRDSRLQRLMVAIAGEDEDIRVVGGAVRNTLLGAPVADVDLATTALPLTIIERARQAGMKPVPTGIEHGTITVVVDGHPFEVTTLRQDVETDGRRAVVAFGRDWIADAARRDFTINALYATRDGRVIDHVGGIQDCAARRVRFIGRPDDRIREDYLRILRFFRFHAAYGAGAPDPDGLAACIRLRAGIADLSAERIGQEMLKLVVAPLAPAVVALMRAEDIVASVIASAEDVGRFQRLHALLIGDAAPTSTRGIENPALLLIATLAGGTPSGSHAIAVRLRLSNAQRDRMVDACRLSADIQPDISDHRLRELAYQGGKSTCVDAAALAAARDDAVRARLSRLLDIIRQFPAPRLPVNGRDLLALGLASGPQVGDALARLETIWIASDFTLGREDLLSLL